MESLRSSRSFLPERISQARCDLRPDTFPLQIHIVGDQGNAFLFRPGTSCSRFGLRRCRKIQPGRRGPTGNRRIALFRRSIHHMLTGVVQSAGSHRYKPTPFNRARYSAPFVRTREVKAIFVDTDSGNRDGNRNFHIKTHATALSVHLLLRQIVADGLHARTNLSVLFQFLHMQSQRLTQELQIQKSAPTAAQCLKLLYRQFAVRSDRTEWLQK